MLDLEEIRYFIFVGMLSWRIWYEWRSLRKDVVPMIEGRASLGKGIEVIPVIIHRNCSYLWAPRQASFPHKGLLSGVHVCV